LGAQYNVTNWFTARAGIAYGKTPVQDGFLTPETPDANRLSYTAGCSATIGKHWSIDVSVLYVQLSREDTNLETGLSGKFSTKVVAPGIGLAYKFQQK
jgi:long-chain fatty acid transport protein